MQLSQIPDKISVAFASSGGRNDIPVASLIGSVPGGASYTDGFPPLTRTPLVSGGVPPSGADMNGILYEISLVNRWLNAGGQFKYDAAFSTAVGGYPKGAVLLSTAEDIQWMSTADNNTTNPDAGGANWVSLNSYGVTVITLSNANVTMSPAQYGKEIVILVGTLTANVQVISPVAQTPFTVYNATTGAFTVTCKTAAGTGAVVEQGGQEYFYSDGTNLQPRLGNTPVKRDISPKPATTRFVKESGSQHNGPIVVSTTRTLTLDEAIGNLIVASGSAAGINITMPSLTGLAGGGIVSFLNSSSFDMTLVRAGTDNFNIGTAGPVTSVVLRPSDSLTMTSLAGNNNWQCYDGSARMPFVPLLQANKATNGFQRLPSGLIIQWGTAVTTAGPAATVITYPIAFPTAAFSVTANNSLKTSSTAYFLIAMGTIGLSTFECFASANISTVGSGVASQTFTWIAVGY